MTDYQGWKNRATWNVNLWAMNDEPTYRRVMEGKPYTPESAQGMAECLFGAETPDGDKLKGVDWAEIAEAWNE